MYFLNGVQELLILSVLMIFEIEFFFFIFLVICLPSDDDRGTRLKELK